MNKKSKAIAAIMLITAAFFATGLKSENDPDNEGGGTYNGHAYIDLGLPSGTLWATCNVGANAPEEYGYYFAWGETITKPFYYRSDFSKTDPIKYKYFNSDEEELTKYCYDSKYGYNGFTDTLVFLQPMDDAATANWGNEWCMPTVEQWFELCGHTTKQWIRQNDVIGCVFTSVSNGNSLFLPAAGFPWQGGLDYDDEKGWYWTCSIDTLNHNPRLASCFELIQRDDGLYAVGGRDRYYGSSVRAVRSSPQKNNSDNVGKNGGGNTHPTEQGEVFQIVEEMPDFPGGTSELSMFLENNLSYPSEAREKNVQGRVFVNFIVEPDGHLSNVKVLRSLGSGCDEEAVRLVTSMPNWKPGKQRGTAVRVSYILPINFKLK